MFLIPSSDLAEILTKLETDLMKLKSSRVLISGASGFIGKWLVATLSEANLLLDLKMKCLFLSGKSDYSGIDFYSKDFIWQKNDFSIKTEKLDFGFSHAFHASTPSNPSTGSLDEVKVKNVAENSMKAMLIDAEQSAHSPNIVHLSSGAIYRGSHEFKKIPLTEEHEILQSKNGSSYSTVKFILEDEIRSATSSGLINGCNARLFAFYGPHLSLDSHFAIGNFMKDSIEGKPIKISGNPETIRSYMYPVDLIILLVKMLVDPSSKPVNIGSKHPFTILEVANLIGTLTKNQGIIFEGNMVEPSSYYPSVTLAEKRYDFSETVSLEDGLLRWKRWLVDHPRGVTFNRKIR
jgi:nucleoside-diphosphate-sugar epimerase